MARSKLKVRKTTDRTPALVISYHITSSALCAQWILSAYLEFVMFYGIVFWGLKMFAKKVLHTMYVEIWFGMVYLVFGIEWCNWFEYLRWWYIWSLLHSLYYCCDKYEQIFVTNMSKCLWQLWANVCGKYDQIFTTNVFRYLRQIYANICVLIWLSEKLLHLSTSWSSPWSHLEIIWSIINIFVVIVIFVRYRQHCHHWHHCNQQQQHHYCQK